jgi:hypothetical protein
MEASARLVAALALAAGASLPALAEPPLVFTRHDFPSALAGELSEGIGVGDLDGDGRPDIVEGGADGLVWYRNPAWTPEVLAAGFRYSAGAAVVVHDVDGDGRPDVVTGRYPTGREDERETVWFANTPGGWVEHRLSAVAFCHDLAFGDLDGDGRADGACVDNFRRQILRLRAPAVPAEEWPSEVIDAAVHAQGMAIADVDRDGRPDVVSGLSWYRNEPDGAWRRVPYTRLRNPADPRFDDHAVVSVLDVDGDGRLDVFATVFADSLQGRVFAFFAPPDPVREPWVPVEIDPGPLWAVHTQAAADFDGSGRVKVMVAEPSAAGYGFGTNPAPEIVVYRLLGPPREAASWERTVVDDTIGTLEGQAADLDGDGLADIVGHEGTPGLVDPRSRVRVSWWRNRTVPRVEPPGPPAPPADPCEGAAEDAGLACACGDGGPPACAGEPLPRRVRRSLERACRLWTKAAAGTASARPAALARALRRAGRRAGRAAARGRLSPACAAALGWLGRGASTHAPLGGGPT